MIALPSQVNEECQYYKPNKKILKAHKAVRHTCDGSLASSYTPCAETIKMIFKKNKRKVEHILCIADYVCSLGY